MKFKVIESRRKKISGTFEGETFDDVFEAIAKRLNIHPSKLKVYGEVLNNSMMRYLIFKGHKKMVVLEPTVDEV